MEQDEITRVRLGAHADTAPEILMGLAADPSPTVRASLAMNPGAPDAVDATLARDPDERVRALLARKLGSIAPSLSAGARVRVQKQAYLTLTALAEDEAVRVRAAIADAVKELPDVPRAIILRLARDESVMVCEPVIRFSPMLTTDDLVALVAAAPSAGTRLAVARRPAIDVSVSDALVSSGTDDVIHALLMNGSALIREAVLDTLAARSAVHSAWQEPLVCRPTLSAQAVKTLSEIVADHLLEVLSARADLDPAMTVTLRARLAKRLDPPPADEPEPVTAKPSEADLLDTLRQGDARRAASMLASAAEVPLHLVERAATLRSAKGLVSLTWKAGFTMTVATALQVLLARLSPGAALGPGPGGSFPLAVQEMIWQLEFLGKPAR